MHLGPTTPRLSHRRRMPWYIESIIDLMLANPQARLQDIAAKIGKHPNTLSAIINTDMFKAAFSQRRQQFDMRYDAVLTDKTQKVADCTLDAILTVLEKKKDQIPLGQLLSINESAMKRLGYGVESPASTVVNVNQQNVQLPPTISRSDLEEARMAVRQVQQTKLLAAPEPKVLELRAVEPPESEDAS